MMRKRKGTEIKEVRSSFLILFAALGVIEAFDAWQTSNIQGTFLMIILRHLQVL